MRYVPVGPVLFLAVAVATLLWAARVLTLEAYARTVVSCVALLVLWAGLYGAVMGWKAFRERRRVAAAQAVSSTHLFAIAGAQIREGELVKFDPLTRKVFPHRLGPPA